MPHRLPFAVLLACVVAFLQAATAQPRVIAPPASGGDGLFVTDQAGLLAPGERQALVEKLAAFERESSTQIVVVILPEIGGADPGDYATELGQQWGVGRGDVDNGAVLLVVTDTRDVFIATGYGLEGAVTDALAGRIIRNEIVPAFRQGRFYAGIDAATTALLDASRGEYTAPERQTPQGELPIGLIFLVFIIIFFIASSRKNNGGGGGGRRRRGPGVIFIPGGFGGGGFGGGGGGFGGGGFGGGGFGGFGGGGFGGGGAGGGW